MTKPILGYYSREAKEVDDQLQKSGDLYYHKKSWVENVEMLLVAAIVVIGATKFLCSAVHYTNQFDVPIFSGMQPMFMKINKVSGLLGRCLDKVLLGASPYKLEAESSGNLYLKIQGQMSFRFDDAKFPEGRFFIFPASVREYVFLR